MGPAPFVVVGVLVVGGVVATITCFDEIKKWAKNIFCAIKGKIFHFIDWVKCTVFRVDPKNGEVEKAPINRPELSMSDILNNPSDFQLQVLQPWERIRLTDNQRIVIRRLSIQ
jgi:hypothetical protein